MADAPDRPPVWKAALAAILDFLLVYLAGGYVFGWPAGGLADEGFGRQGLTALPLFALIFGSFWLLNRQAGGTLFRHLLGIPKPLPWPRHCRTRPPARPSLERAGQVRVKPA